MTTENNQIVPTDVAVYACGGGGSNIVYSGFSGNKVRQEGFATTHFAYVDTSTRNFTKHGIPDKDTFSFEGKDGGGKKRDMNASSIRDELNKALKKFPPHLFNLVVHTAGGASGSVIGPQLVKELKSRGLYVISIVIGTVDSIKEIDNTIKTLQSYDSLAEQCDSSCIVFYLENGKNGAEIKTINEIAKYVISCLLALLSGQNAPTDTADLKHWIDYGKVTDATPQLASLSIVTKTEDMKDMEAVMSVATLSSEGLDNTIPIIPPYRTIGMIHTPVVTEGGSKKGLLQGSPIHFIIQEDKIHADIKELQKKLDGSKLINASSMKRKRISDGVKSDDDGMVY